MDSKGLELNINTGSKVDEEAQGSQKGEYTSIRHHNDDETGLEKAAIGFWSRIQNLLFHGYVGGLKLKLSELINKDNIPWSENTTLSVDIKLDHPNPFEVEKYENRILIDFELWRKTIRGDSPISPGAMIRGDSTPFTRKSASFNRVSSIGSLSEQEQIMVSVKRISFKDIAVIH